jgi:triosephosphate isomerase
LAKKVSQKVADNIRIIYGGSVNGKNCKELGKSPYHRGVIRVDESRSQPTKPTLMDSWSAVLR